ncbi:MAG: hypothetical protein AABX34_05505 [Nanoarchaeota archaeon]
MSNKKGGLDIEDFVGALVLIFVMVALGLLFYGCSISNAKQNYEQMKFSKTQIEVAEELNRLLQIEITWNGEEKKMSEALEKRIKDYFLLGVQPEAEQKKFKEDIKAMTSPYIAYGRRFMILTPEGACCVYDSYNKEPFRQIGYEDTPESVALLPVPLGQDKYEFIPFVLQSLT